MTTGDHLLDTAEQLHLWTWRVAVPCIRSEQSRPKSSHGEGSWVQVLPLATHLLTIVSCRIKLGFKPGLDSLTTSNDQLTNTERRFYSILLRDWLFILKAECKEIIKIKVLRVESRTFEVRDFGIICLCRNCYILQGFGNQVCQFWATGLYWDQAVVLKYEPMEEKRESQSRTSLGEGSYKLQEGDERKRDAGLGVERWAGCSSRGRLEKLVERG